MSNNLISPIQYGFKKNCSTNEAVLDIYNKLLDNMDKKLITCSILLDLRKAYDAINHTILIKKLEKYEIRGLPLQLPASYPTDQQQYTIVNQYKSKSRDVICGILRAQPYVRCYLTFISMILRCLKFHYSSFCR